MNQLSFSIKDGKQLRDNGISRAVLHAEDHFDGKWAEKALDFLYIYVRSHQKFSAEMVRIESKGLVPESPSLRAWGSILLQGAKRGWIKRIGTIQVTNPKAHSCYASEWESVI